MSEWIGLRSFEFEGDKNFNDKAADIKRYRLEPRHRQGGNYIDRSGLAFQQFFVWVCAIGAFAGNPPSFQAQTRRSP